VISHRGPVSGVAAHAGSLVATAGYDNQVILWDAVTKHALSRANHDHLVNHLVFSVDGRYLLTSSSDYSARLWSVPDLRLVSVFAAHHDDVEMAAFHPSEHLVATASRDNTIGVYGVDGSVRACLRGHTADVLFVAWSADGTELVSVGADGTLKRWSLARGGPIADIDTGGVSTGAVAVAEDGVIFAGTGRGEIVTVTPEGIAARAAHSAGVACLVYHAARRRLVSLSQDRTRTVWSVRNGIQEIGTSNLPAEVWPRSGAFLDDDTLVTGTFGASYATHRISTGAWDLRHVAPTPGLNAVTTMDGAVFTVGDAGVVCRDGEPLCAPGSLCDFLTPAGPVLLTGGQLGVLFDAVTGRELYRHPAPLTCAVRFTAADGATRVVVGADTGEGVVLECRPDGTLAHRETLRLHENAVQGVAAAGGVIFSVSSDAGAAWFDAATLREIGRLAGAHDKIANGCVALPDGRFASVSRDLTLRFWDGRRAEPGEVMLTPHDHSIKCVSASTDGRLLATGSYSGMLAVRDLTRRRWQVIPRRTTSGISSLHFDDAGRRFLASSYDGNVYDIPCGEL
jgi:WD40 repeat protein